MNKKKIAVLVASGLLLCAGVAFAQAPIPEYLNLSPDELKLCKEANAESVAQGLYVVLKQQKFNNKIMMEMFDSHLSVLKNHAEGLRSLDERIKKLEERE